MTYPPSPYEPPPYDALPYPERGYGPPPGPPPGYPPGYPPSFPPGGGYPAGRGYPAGGYPGGPPPGGPPRNTGWVIGLIAVLTVAVLAFAALAWKFGPDSTTTAGTTTTTAAAPRTTTTTTTTTTPTTTSPTTSSKPLASTCDEHAAGPGPQTPAGWSTVNTPRGLVYDVPPEWEVLSCSTLVGWEKPCDDGPFGYCPVRMMSGAAALRNDTCESESHAVSGAPGSSDITDIDQAVRTESTKVADIFTSADGVVPNVTLGEPRQFAIDGTPAVELVATVDGVAPGDCATSPGGLHLMVATTMPDQPGTVLFVISMSQGGDGDPDPALAEQILATLRHGS